MDILRERRTVNEVASFLKVHASTIWRWIDKGVRGHKLPSVAIGGKRFILDSDLHAFLGALNANNSRFTQDLSGRVAVANAQLDAMGVQGGRRD